MYLEIVFPPLLHQFWSVWNDCPHIYKSLVFGDEFSAHLKSHQRCSAAFCRPIKFFHTDWIIISLWSLSYTQRHCHVRIENGSVQTVAITLDSLEYHYMCVPVWLSGRALCLLRKRLWVRFPGNTCTNEKCITWMHCKSLWIKASAKCINVNVYAETLRFVLMKITKVVKPVIRRGVPKHLAIKRVYIYIRGGHRLIFLI